MDSMEEARFLLSQDINRDITIPKVEHVEIKHLYLERSQDWVGRNLGLPDNPLKQVRVVVTWGSVDNPQFYVLEERFNKPTP